MYKNNDSSFGKEPKRAPAALPGSAHKRIQDHVGGTQEVYRVKDAALMIEYFERLANESGGSGISRSLGTVGDDYVQPWKVLTVVFEEETAPGSDSDQCAPAEESTAGLSPDTSGNQRAFAGAGDAESSMSLDQPQEPQAALPSHPYPLNAPLPEDHPLSRAQIFGGA